MILWSLIIFIVFRILSTILESTPVGDIDGFVRVIVSTLSQSNRILPFLKSIITNEINKTSDTNVQGSILRGNSATTKIETAYTS